jgi:hypothetical protein
MQTGRYGCLLAADATAAHRLSHYAVIDLDGGSHRGLSSKLTLPSHNCE